MERLRRTAARRRALPAHEPATGTRTVLRTADAAPLILVVDDAEDTRGLYAEFFSDAGWQVAHAVDGEHALLKVVSLMPDLVVMDLAMPVLDGWEATHKIKTHVKTKHIPVIVLTGRVTRPELRRAEDAGADIVLMKPCTPEALLTVARRLVPR